MKIKILTNHCIPNFGSVFQCYALYSFIKNIGYKDVEVIDYRPSYFVPHSLRSLAAMFIHIDKYVKRKRKFDSFIENNIKLSNKIYYSYDQLKNANIQADILIAGGDQLWNPYHECGRDNAYKLTFSDNKKISYATSLGQSNLSDDDLLSLADKIKSFSAISVRESSSVPLLNKVGIKARMCVDPVFLLSEIDYMKFIKPVPNNKYLLVYLVTPSTLLDNSIRILSEIYGLKVILCSGFSKKCECDIFLKDLGPDEILSYLYHADIILSSSFHATSFSLLFHKQFFTILPNPKTNERIVDLLTIRGLSNRIITESTDLTKRLSEKVNYDDIPDYKPYIDASCEYLKHSLE